MHFGDCATRPDGDGTFALTDAGQPEKSTELPRILVWEGDMPESCQKDESKSFTTHKAAALYSWVA